MYTIPTLPLQIDLESKAVLRQLNQANKKLAELKGVALTIPNESILINTLILQEAKESSAVYEGENETYIEASAENSGSILYDKEIRDKPRTRRTKRNV